jgi:L-ascorbate metabolism protein UlaG (beta-lactamase superfamily)
VKITKHPHAHLTVELDGRRLVIDPGMFSSDAGEDSVDAVVLTHEHGDHWSPENLRALRERNPGVPLYGPSVVATAASEFAVTPVAAADVVTAGPFELRFVGGGHAPIHDSFPPMDNLAVVVNGTVFHPGDSYTLPEADVTVAAVPIGGPWHKLAETIDWISAFRPPRLITLHDAVLSPAGQAMAVDVLRGVAAQWGGTVTALEPGESIEI